MDKSQTISGTFHTFRWKLGEQVICRLTVNPESDERPGCISEEVGCTVVGSAIVGEADVFGRCTNPQVMFLVRPNNYKQKFWVNEAELSVGKSEDDLMLEAGTDVLSELQESRADKTPVELAKELEDERARLIALEA